MKFKSEQERNDVLAKVSLLTLSMIITTSLVILIAGYFLANNVKMGSLSNADLIRNVLFAVALAELAAIYVVKKSMLAKLKDVSEYNSSVMNNLQTINIVITAMCVAIAIYGLVAVILGSKFDVLVFFVAVSLIAYQIFRLRARDFEK